MSRQTIHNWIGIYEQGGLAALADRSHRPRSCAHQTDAEIEALICEMRRVHAGWRPRRNPDELEHKLVAVPPTHGRRVSVSDGPRVKTASVALGAPTRSPPAGVALGRRDDDRLADLRALAARLDYTLAAACDSEPAEVAEAERPANTLDAVPEHDAPTCWPRP